MSREERASVRTADFDFDLPPDRIAQHPCEPRDAARLYVLPRAGGAGEHRGFRDLETLLRPGDLLVLNDTRVLPARLFGVRATGGKVECLLVREMDGAAGRWEALVRAGGRARPGETIELAGGALRATLEAKAPGGVWTLALTPPAAVHTALEAHGIMPLPPYISRRAASAGGPEEDAGERIRALDRERYQTVFASAPGAVAAPTAGLHFTDDLLARLAARGVARCFVTLHVGPGTFRPVEVEDPREHPMHRERYAMPEATRDAIVATRAAGGRVIACGTTATRTIETVAEGAPLEGETGIFIYPPYEPRWVDGLITNFHLPRSTLLMLVSAFAGRERILDAYADAIREGYRFYSYGDAMLLA